MSLLLRRPLVAAVVGALVVLAVVAGVAWARSDAPPPKAAFSGCLDVDAGRVLQVALGDKPSIPCTPEQQAVSWEGQAVVGLNGTDGDAGAEGAVGPRGDTGPGGPQGPAGPAGPQGPAGPNGTPGVQGVAGKDGASGPAGPAGPAGSVGPTGPAGVTGYTVAVGTLAVPAASVVVGYVACPTGTLPISGGWTLTPVPVIGTFHILESGIVFGTVWQFRFENLGPFAITANLQAVCIPSN